MASLSNEWVTHPPRSNPPLRSSSGPPSPCITPSTVTIVVVVSFMIAVPVSLVGRRSVRPDHRTDLIGCGTASALSYQAPAVYAGARHPNEGLSHEMDQLTGSGHGLDFCGEGPQEGCRVLRTHRSRPNRQRSECYPTSHGVIC